jgi:hypothetical protein
MRLRAAVLVTGLALSLASCAGSTRWVVSPPPAALVEACAAPVALPAGALSRAQVLALWGRDRVALADCAARQQALSQHNLGF